MLSIIELDGGYSLTSDDDKLAFLLLASKPGKSVQHPVIDTTIAIISTTAVLALVLSCFLFFPLLLLPLLLPLFCSLLVAVSRLFAASATNSPENPFRACSHATQMPVLRQKEALSRDGTRRTVDIGYTNTLKRG